MNKLTLCASFFLLAVQSFAQIGESRRDAQITNEGGQGRCEIEVEVDAAADVAVRGSVGVLRTLAGGPAVWRRFKCNRPMPRNPFGFQFRGIDGRGNVRLIQDPARGGEAVVRIEDPKGGREGYTFALLWQGEGDEYRGGGGFDRDRDQPRFDRDQVARQCADAVVDRLRRDGYRDVRIIGASAEDRPGRRDRVMGRASAQERWGNEEFVFACVMNFQDGNIRSVDVVPR